ncbi:zinc ribbon domain-containing protein [Lentibacillus halophilus]|uniref:Zinc ribbon domain-containing protein n=1 Tax=Lentibacillus halophilus TaxID=295065 RepID=A0ABP3JBM0_9BACI
MKKPTNTKQQINDLTSTKSKRLIELGQEVYLAYRRGESIEPIVEEKASAVQELDTNIYDLLKEAGQKKEEPAECTCGAMLAREDVFCPECGKAVNGEEEDAEVLTVCWSCTHEVPADAAYCPVCGVQIEIGRPDR